MVYFQRKHRILSTEVISNVFNQNTGKNWSKSAFYTPGIQTWGKNGQIAWYILYNRKLYFPNGGRNWRNNWKPEGVFAGIGSYPPVQVPDELIALQGGRPMKKREKIFCAFWVKSVYDFPTTRLLIENLKTNPVLRRLCGPWVRFWLLPHCMRLSGCNSFEGKGSRAGFFKRLGHVPNRHQQTQK